MGGRYFSHVGELRLRILHYLESVEMSLLHSRKSLRITSVEGMWYNRDLPRVSDDELSEELRKFWGFMEERRIVELRKKREEEVGAGRELCVDRLIGHLANGY